MITFLGSSPTQESDKDLTIFLSASIPDAKRWRGGFDALEITDAVVALARAVLPEGIRLVSAAHPTISPLLVYVATELELPDPEQVVIYQSRLFEDVLPEETRRFEREAIGRFVWTPALDGDEPVPDRWHPSLRLMRETMFAEEQPSAAVFIGGMEGILTEAEMFVERFPDRPLYALGRPGGEARDVPERFASALANELRNGDVYPALWRRVVADLRHRQ